MIYVGIPVVLVLIWMVMARRATPVTPEDFVAREDLPDPRQWAIETFNVSLDSDQAVAVGVTTERDALIAARAGSGKTRVLTTRALWLQDVCGVAPSELLLLAFNRAAAREMTERVRQHVGHEAPHVMTFHALGWAANTPERLIADNPNQDQWAQSAEIANIVRSERLSSVVKRLVSSASLQPTLKRLKIAPFVGDWYGLENDQLDIVAEDAKAAAGDTEADSSAGPRPRIVLQGADTALDGTEVKSYGERMISNVLFKNAVKYEYEKLIKWDAGTYRPDFTISTGPDSGVAIEYFGLMKDREYRKVAARKRAYWADKPDWTLVSLEPKDLKSRGEEGFGTFLLEKLADLGVESRPLSQDEIDAALPEVVYRDSYLEPFTSFVVRCRVLGLSHQNLHDQIRDYSPGDLEEAVFLEAVTQIYAVYLEEVIGDGCDDYSGIVWGAAEMIAKGEIGLVRQGGRDLDLRQVRHVLIDEFQDFSEPFYALVRALRTVNPTIKVFAVGDDWQAINRFAGSDLKFFEGFSDLFPGSIRHELPNNYRSTKPIVEVSNALMVDRQSKGQHGGVAASGRQWGKVRLWYEDTLQLSVGEEVNHDGRKITAAVLRLIKDHLDKGWDVALLSRTNATVDDLDLQDYLKELHEYLPDQDLRRLSISTTHRYKGLEADAVIVLDARTGRYPLIHHDRKFQRLLGDTEDVITDAERRLFYVALTRARWSLDILARDEESQSPFVARLGAQLGSWNNLPPGDHVGPEMLQVRVSNTFTVKDEVRGILSSRNFKWNWEDYYWHKSVLPSQLPDFSILERQEWFVPPVVVEVLSTTTGEVVWSSRAGG